MIINNKNKHSEVRGGVTPLSPSHIGGGMIQRNGRVKVSPPNNIDINNQQFSLKRIKSNKKNIYSVVDDQSRLIKFSRISLKEDGKLKKINDPETINFNNPVNIIKDKYIFDPETNRIYFLSSGRGYYMKIIDFINVLFNYNKQLIGLDIFEYLKKETGLNEIDNLFNGTVMNLLYNALAEDEQESSLNSRTTLVKQFIDLDFDINMYLMSIKNATNYTKLTNELVERLKEAGLNKREIREILKENCTSDLVEEFDKREKLRTKNRKSAKILRQKYKNM